MKKLFFLIIVCSFGLQSFAQKGKQDFWISIEPKLGINYTFFVNLNVFDDDGIDMNASAWPLIRPNAGLSIGIHPAEFFAMNYELGFNNSTQKYRYHNSNVFEDKTLQMKTMEHYLTFRFYDEDYGYGGLGAKMSIPKVYCDGTDKSNWYKNHFFSAVLEFGAAVYSNDILDLNISFRFSYALTDMMSTAAKDQERFFGWYPEAITTDFYDTYAPTNPAVIQFSFACNFHIAKD